MANLYEGPGVTISPCVRFGVSMFNVFDILTGKY